LGAGDGDGRGGTQAEVAAKFGADHRAGEFALGPREIDFEAAPGFEAGDRAAGPDGRERGQELEDASVALHEQFGDAGGVAKVTIDLKWRVRVEQVLVEAAALHRGLRGAHEIEKILDDFVGVVAVQHAGPEIDLPTHGPTGGFVAAELEGAGDGAEKFGRGVGGDLVAGVEAVKVGEVAVLGVGLFVVGAPLQELAAMPGRELVAVFTVLGPETRELGVGALRVAIAIAGVVLAASEIKVMPSTDLLVIRASACTNVAHRVAAPALCAQVRLTAMDDSAVVEAALIGLELDRNQLGDVALRGFDLVVKHRFAGFERIVVGESHLTAGVRSG